MSFHLKSILIFSLIFTILISVAFLLLEGTLVKALGTQSHIILLALIGCTLLVLSGYVWDRSTIANLTTLKQQIEVSQPEAPHSSNSSGLEIPRDGQNEILGIARQIEQMAQSLQKVDARYRAIVEDQTDLVCRYLPDGKLTFVNNAYCDFVSDTRENLAGQLFFPFSPDQNSNIHKLIKELSSKNPIATFEYEMALADGTVKWHQWTNRAIFDNYGRLFEHQAVGRDITDRKQLEEQVRQSQKLDSIGQLAAGIAHDFNNILTVIQGHANLLLSPDRPRESSKRSAEQICLATEHASNLSRQLLVFSSKQVMHTKPLDLNEIIQNLTKMLARILNEDIHLELECMPRLPQVKADSGMMEQIIFNLTVNARDAMPEGGTLTVKTSTEIIGRAGSKRHPEAYSGRFVKLTVRDTGCGIKPENLSQIFEPFFTTKGVGKGSGLGLSTVYGIVKQHNGWTEVASQVGHGTVFDIFLPFIESKNREPEPPVATPEAAGGVETILLTEDEPVLRELVKDILEDLGYRIIEAESGPAALEQWKQHKNDIELLVTDMVMPDGMNGKELAEKLLGERPDLKVLYMSGYSAGVVGKELCLREGINFMQKPFDPANLAKTIRKRLDEEVTVLI